MSTLERLQALLARDFGLDAGRLRPDATLESLDIDSLRLIEIVFSIEDEFAVTMPPDQAQIASRVRTLGDLAGLVDELASQAGTPP